MLGDGGAAHIEILCQAVDGQLSASRAASASSPAGVGNAWNASNVCCGHVLRYLIVCDLLEFFHPALVHSRVEFQVAPDFRKTTVLAGKFSYLSPFGSVSRLLQNPSDPAVPGAAFPGIDESFKRNDFEYLAMEDAVESNFRDGAGAELKFLTEDGLEIVFHEPLGHEFGLCQVIPDQFGCMRVENWCLMIFVIMSNF